MRQCQRNVLYRRGAGSASRARNGRRRARSEEGEAEVDNEEEEVLTEVSIARILARERKGAKATVRNDVQSSTPVKKIAQVRVEEEKEEDEQHRERTPAVTTVATTTMTTAIDAVDTEELWRAAEKRFEVIKRAYDTAEYVRRRGDSAGAAALERGARAACIAACASLEAAAEADVRASATARILMEERDAALPFATNAIVDAWLPEPSTDAVNVLLPTTIGRGSRLRRGPSSSPKDDEPNGRDRRAEERRTGGEEEGTKQQLDSSHHIAPTQSHRNGESRDSRTRAGKVVDDDDIVIEVAAPSAYCRRIDARVEIDAPPKTVYDVLVDYEHLGDFIPGLAENKVLHESPHGCTLLQASMQKVGLGMQVRVETVIEVLEVPNGFGSGGDISLEHASGDGNGAAALQPLMCISEASSMDICFSMIESRELREFIGTWRVQRGEYEDGDGEEDALSAAKTTSLSYTVKVVPKPWLPAVLVEARIANEVRLNLQAVRDFTERLHSTHTEPKPAA